MEPKEIKSWEDYYQYFSSLPTDSPKRKEALEKALDVRKFEISLYWKRTQYFWAILAATFAGYALLVNTEHPSYENQFAQFALASLGLVFSLGWYLVNRGSKYWQLNWEKHVDMLENDLMGPLFKITLNRNDFRFWTLTGPYRFSVSKVNQLISLYVFLFWFFVWCRHLWANLHFPIMCRDIDWTFVLIGISTIAIVISFFVAGVSGKGDTTVKFLETRPEYREKH
jgi:hypothetical protein